MSYTFDYSGVELNSAFKAVIDSGLSATSLTLNVVTDKAGIVSDALWSDVVAVNYVLESILFAESAGVDVVLKIGTTSGARDVLYQHKLLAGTKDLLVFNRFFSSTSGQHLYVESNDWNGAEVDATIKLYRLTG